jgi:integrase
MASDRKAAKRVCLKQTGILDLPRPRSGRVYVYDTEVRGLGICITAGGSRTWYYYAKVNGRPVRERLGTFPEINVVDARRLARDRIVSVAKGEDPQQRKRERREELTFGDAFEHLIDYMESHRKKPRTISEYRRIYTSHLEPTWKARRLSTIKAADVAKAHNTLGKRAPYQANRLLALIKVVFNRAPGDVANPATKIESFPEESRDRYLTSAELPKFFTALETEPNLIFQAFFWICLLTGQRRRNVEAMRWEEVDFARAYWRVPDTKANMPVIVPLSPEAIAVLIGLRGPGEPSCLWVFPAHRSDSKTGHIGDPIPAWRRLLKRAGIENLRIHDLRRSLGSWQAHTGASLPIIGKTLGHLRQETTAIYARLQLDPVRDSVS